MGTTITTYSYQYNSFNKATKITQGDYELEIFYGHDKERRKTILKDGENTVYTRFYLGNYEKEITSEGTIEYYYISGPSSNIAVYISENGAEPELYYTITDHLGSIVAVTDADGEIIEEQRYDPWGNYRNPLTGEPEETPQLTMLFRGYTGHEMLPEFGLINMNGRLYDPVIARVLSPDNYVQNPYNPQNYNRYSYCYNNPLVYTDPDGEFVVPLAATILVGGYMHFTGHTSSEIFKTVVPLTASLIVPQFTTAYNFLMSPVYANQLGMSAAQGYLGGVISTGLSFLPRIGGVNMPFGVNLLLGVIQGGVYGGFYAMLWGGNVGKGFKRGAIIGASTTTATSENLINLIRGGGFYTDQKIYNKLLSNNENQEIIDYFVGQGNYRPGIGDVANVNNETYEITFSEKAFEKGWKYFKMVYHEELYHYADKMAGNYNHIGKDQWHTGNPEAMFAYHRGEYKAKVYGYRNQWRYSNIKYDWVSYIDRHGCQMNYPPFPDHYTFFQVRAWHLLYKIPRRW